MIICFFVFFCLFPVLDLQRAPTLTYLYWASDDDPLAYARSPRMRLASWMSLGMMVTRLAWIAHRLVSSKSPTRYASDAS